MIAALTSVLRRAAAAPDPEAFWAAATPSALVPYFRTFHTAAALHLRADMAADLDLFVAQVEQTTTAVATLQQ